MNKKKDDKGFFGCVIVLGIFIIAMMIIVVIFSTKDDRELKISKQECRDLGGYIETFYKSNKVICRNREGTSIYFRK